MSTYYTQYVQPSCFLTIPDYVYPPVINEWHQGLAPNILTTPILTMPAAIVTPPHIQTYPHILTNASIPTDTYYTPENSTTDVNVFLNEALEDVEDICYNDNIEFYLTLPKNLFPTPRMLTLDPNPIIDEFCKMENVHDNMGWILDLEFGIPTIPVTRAIPLYDVKFNSVQCKNTPSAIHPGFESCSKNFKREFLFYYDCIVSAWYRGFMILKGDKSVKNFQAWLLIPMQMFGMCWP